MKPKRICSFLMVLITLFTLLGQLALPVSAVYAKDLGISVKSSKYYNYDKKCYTMKFTVTQKSGAPYHPLDTPVIKAYLYNAEGKCVMQWTNGGKGYPADKEEKSISFSIDAAKLKSGEYTFKFYVCCEYFDDRWNSVEKNFYWKYTLNKSDMVQSIKFKQMSYGTDSKGQVRPRVNVTYKNLKGETLTIRYYDKYDNVLYTISTSAPLKNHDGSTWFAWNGIADGSQYPDGNYKVKITSTGGLSITETFYFDFPGYKNK